MRRAPPASSDHYLTTPKPCNRVCLFSTIQNSLPISDYAISTILVSCPNKQSDSDLVPTWLLKITCFSTYSYHHQFLSGHRHAVKDFRYLFTSQETYSRHRPTLSSYSLFYIRVFLLKLLTVCFFI